MEIIQFLPQDSFGVINHLFGFNKDLYAKMNNNNYFEIIKQYNVTIYYYIPNNIIIIFDQKINSTNQFSLSLQSFHKQLFSKYYYMIDYYTKIKLQNKWLIWLYKNKHHFHYSLNNILN